jgi:hypothetical protein
MVGQVVNLRRIGNPPVEGVDNKSLLPNTPPIRLSTWPESG